MGEDKKIKTGIRNNNHNIMTTPRSNALGTLAGGEKNRPYSPVYF